MQPNLKDASLIETASLPAGSTAAPVVTYSTGIDLGGGTNFAAAELLIDAPALTTAQLPDDKTIDYAIQTDDNAAFNSPTLVVDKCLTQTGAGGAGAAAAAARVGIPSSIQRYVRLRTTLSATSADPSSKTATFSVVV